MASIREVLIFSMIVATVIGLPSKSHRGSHGHPIPPEPRNQGNFEVGYNHEEIARRINSWKPEDPENIWELSGLYQGDIMLSPNNKISDRNGILDTTTRWPNGIVPYYIEEEDFDRSDIKVIKSGIKEYHNKTCLRFRPYKESDTDYVRIQGNRSGCWSMVGRHGKGQVLNLQVGGCVRHGVVVHELMHALGFYHQQSAANRDEWVVIHWDNIKPGKEHNFKKYDQDTVTDFGYPYDYSSVMHYSAHAFSANGQETITPKVEDAKIGQRNGLSKIDVSKLQAMYKDECDNRETEEKITSESEEDLSFIWTLD
ncbi:seminal metalloprotease 1-like [Vespa velutina]|uniref:seminal metalloprotease 1-like n=1 Tax=Vespa velutina TaxID=202808 RepID=UPI001FB1FB37|nr:seminal metalloprotease 1-like [Vespa velutina]